MKQLVTVLLLFMTLCPPVFAANAHDHAIPTLSGQASAFVTTEEDTLTITFGPIDLPTGHSGDLGASMPKHVFEMPEDRFFTGYQARVFKKDGTQLPGKYLHHMLLIDLTKESLACPGEAYFVAGSGMELLNARFPDGYGVKLERRTKLMAVVAFYHSPKPTKDVMASLTLKLAPRGRHLQHLEVYHVGVNAGCYTRLSERIAGETDDGIPIRPGLQVNTTPLSFPINGCVKFAYPHGHDHLLLIVLENKTTGRTLLRTIPDVAPDGSLLAFPNHQVYSDPLGFAVSTRDRYEIAMVYHRPLQDSQPRHGMGNYILYLTQGTCFNGHSSVQPPAFIEDSPYSTRNVNLPDAVK